MGSGGAQRSKHFIHEFQSFAVYEYTFTYRGASVPKKSLIEQSKWIHYAMCKNGRKLAGNAENEMNDTPVSLQTATGQDC